MHAPRAINLLFFNRQAASRRVFKAYLYPLYNFDKPTPTAKKRLRGVTLQ